MAGQASLNSLLQWGIDNSSESPAGATAQGSTGGAPRDAVRGFNPAAMAELLGGPSDADRMRDAMTAIVAPPSAVSLEQKLIAWDNFEQLVEQIDNANNLEPMGLWPPLLAQLDGAEPEMRRMAAWCVATAVQNNVKAQERLRALGGVAALARLALADGTAAVRKKAITALSGEVRNYPPALLELEKLLPADVWTSRGGGLDAGDMEAVDELMQALRDHSSRM